MLFYLDWNVFDKIEKMERLDQDEKNIYLELSSILGSEGNYVPYSNAHLKDLVRGYKKNPDYIHGHLEIIVRLTNNLCICQYWEKQNVTWHYRRVVDFFDELKDEQKSDSETFEDLLDSDRSIIGKLQKELLECLPVPKEFKSIYSEDPIFNIIYPRTKIEMNVFALASDLHDFSSLINSDYSLYRSLKQILIKTMVKFQKNHQIYRLLKTSNVQHPKYLEIDLILDEFSKNQKADKGNPYFHKIFDTFFKFDLKGYKTDGQFPNMVDDALHTFYAAHCDIFITNDDRCKYKAEKTYERLKISTGVYSPKEFIEMQLSISAPA